MFRKKNKIVWTSIHEEINNIPELHIKPTREFIPEWFKNTPIFDNPKAVIPNREKTVRTCPSFTEIFNEGFVMVAPTDIFITVNEQGMYSWQTPNEKIYMELHSEAQYLKYANVPNARLVLKLVSGWWCFTPSGYSVRQLPLFYDDNPDFYVPYGTIKTDLNHEINPQIIITNKKDKIFIKQGQPLCSFVPFKRNDKLNLSVESNKKYLQKIQDKKFWIAGSSYRSNYHKFN